MAIKDRFNQRVRASKHGEEEEDYDVGYEDEFPDEVPAIGESAPLDRSEDQDKEDQGSSDVESGVPLEDGQDSTSDPEVSDEEGPMSRSDPSAALANISFGALASAQASLDPSSLKPTKRKRSTQPTAIPRKRRSRSPSPFHEAEERAAGRKLSFNTSAQRASKHAPRELSSKKAVSRKRSVVYTPQSYEKRARDPRFSAATGPLNTSAVSQNYAFLNDYRQSEMQTLKAEMRTTPAKDGKLKEGLKMKLKSMEDQERTRQRFEREQEVKREHRKREREAVGEGKKPYFLKKGDVKREVLRKQFEGMSEKKRDRTMERRRKKVTGRERKMMPDKRRVVEA